MYRYYNYINTFQLLRGCVYDVHVYYEGCTLYILHNLLSMLYITHNMNIMIFQLLRGWVYILPIIIFSLLYNIPKFAEVRPCQVKLLSKFSNLINLILFD